MLENPAHVVQYEVGRNRIVVRFERVMQTSSKRVPFVTELNGPWILFNG